MKIINNQDSLLLTELENLITPKTNIYISCNHFTAFALFELIGTFSKSKQIRFLVSNNFNDVDDFRFIQNESENKLNMFLDRKYRINQVLGLINYKVEISKETPFLRLKTLFKKS